AIVMLSSDAPFDAAHSAARAIERSPRDFTAAGIHRAEDVLAALSLDAEGTRAFAEGTPPNTDDRNLLATSDRPSSRVPGQWLSHAFAPHEPLAAFADSVDPSHLALRLYSNEHLDRAPQLADRLDPARRHPRLRGPPRPPHR